MTRTKVFMSYSHDDERWRRRACTFLTVLEREGLVELWDDGRLRAGEEWLPRLNEEMLLARVAILLISASFLTSAFILEHEVPRIFDQHQANGMIIYPFLIKPCPWQEVSWLARMQIRPANARPLASFRGVKTEEVLASFAREIAEIAHASQAS
jgi:hypothetical protein